MHTAHIVTSCITHLSKLLYLQALSLLHRAILRIREDCTYC